MLNDQPEDLLRTEENAALLRESLLRLRSSIFRSSPNSPTIESYFYPAQGPDELGRIGYYRILRLLGEGGMGRVYQAEDTRLERQIALKILLPVHAGSSQSRERFLREARVLASLTHPNIVTVYEVGVVHGSDGISELPYIAMQLLLGETLESAVLRQGALPVGEAVRLGRETAEGLAIAHDRGLIHRDIKPANLWVEEPSGQVKILDFGLARLLTGGNTRLSSEGLMVGTPSFMAPEQARGDEIDGRADLFSLGCVLYTILAGEVPFDGPSVMAILTRLAVHEPPPLYKRVPAIPRELSNLVEQMLAKTPAQRPASARQVAARLAQLSTGHYPSHTTTQPVRGLNQPTQTMQRGSTDSEIPVSASPAPSRRNLLLAVGGVAGLASLGAVAWWWNQRGPVIGSGEPIRVGVLHSATGTMSASETPVLEMTLLALEQLNTQGGLLGRQVIPVLGDGASSEHIFASEAERLINQEKVAVLYGCWTSASRKAVKEVVEARRHLLFYPVQYEGLEQSPRIIYTGAAPNQQLLPAAEWAVKDRARKTFFLVGSDYIFPRTANVLLRHRLEELAGPGAVVGEEYLPLGSTETRRVVEAIREARPQVILNTINGDSNGAFFQALRRAEVMARDTLLVSFSLDEQSMRGLDRSLVSGTYMAWNYFASLPGEPNRTFKEQFQKRWGAFKAVTDPMEAAWLSVRFWAQAVERCQQPEDQDAVLRSLPGMRVEAPEGPDVRIDAENHHTWKYFRLGRISPTGEIQVVYSDETPTRPEPFPRWRTRAEWEAWQNELYRRWGNRWSAPVDG